MAVSDEIIVMNNARIAQIGTPHQLYDAPSSAFIADFIGDASLPKCRIEAVSGGVAQVRIGEQCFEMPSENRTKGAAKMVLRPHDITLCHPKGATLTGEVTYAAYLGKEIQYTVESDIGSLFVVSAVTADAFRRGQAVGIRFDPRQARLVPDHEETGP